MDNCGFHRDVDEVKNHHRPEVRHASQVGQMTAKI